MSSLYEKYKDKLPPEMTESTVNSMSEDLVIQLVESYSVNLGANIPKHMQSKNEEANKNEMEQEDLEDVEELPDELRDFIEEETNDLEELNVSEPESTSIEIDGKETPVKKKKKAKKVTKAINFGEKKEKLSINLVDVSTLSAESSYNAFLKKKVKATYMVVNPISGYEAHVRGMTIEEIDFLKSSISDYYDTQEKIRKIVFSCIESSSIPFKDYDDFLAKTANAELKNLMFGIMIGTFGSISNFSYKCPECDSENTIEVNLNSIVKLHSDKIGNLIDLILTTENVEELFDYIPLHRDIKRVKLPETQLVLDIKFPSLKTEVETSKFFRKVGKGIESSSLVTFLMIADSLYLPYFEEGSEEPKGYSKITSIQEKYNYLKNLVPKDMKILENSIEDYSDYLIDFYLKDQSCSECGTKVEKIEFDVIENFIKAILTEV